MPSKHTNVPATKNMRRLSCRPAAIGAVMALALQDAGRHGPDNSLYRTEIKKWRSLEAQKEQGNTAFKSGRYQEAIDAWSICLDIDPTNRLFNAKLLCNRATAQSKLRNHDAAVADCGRAIELDQNYVKAYNRRAESLRVLGSKEQLEQALQDYDKASDLDEDDKKREYKQKMREVQAEIKRAGRKDFYKVSHFIRQATRHLAALAPSLPPSHASGSFARHWLLVMCCADPRRAERCTGGRDQKGL